VNRRIVINLVWFGLIASLFLAWAVRNILPVDAINRPYEVTADFASSLGMQPGNEVDYLGVQYGSVGSIRRVPGGVRVTMKIDRGKRIPAGASAHLFRKSAIGEQYVELSPPSGRRGTKQPAAGRWLAEGAHIPMSRTSVPLEFSELLRSASRLVSSIPADDVRTLVHDLAVGLHGRTDSLRQLADAGDRISATLAARSETLDRLTTNNTRITHVITAHRGSLGQTLADLRKVADTLRDARGDLSVLLERGSIFLGETADIVAHQKGNLDCDLKDLEIVIDETTTTERLDGLRTVLRVGPEGFGALWDVRDVKPDAIYARVGFLENVENKAPQFVPAKELPPVAVVPPCNSALPASTGTYVPGTPRRILPATGTRLALGAVAVLLFAGALLRRLARLRSAR
jgi:phospholipid/cholesterol/gamma-HCH transport system substrate-binding protein